MRKLSLWLTLGLFSFVGTTFLGACGSDDDEDKSKGSGGTGGIPENTGSQCAAPADCFKDIVTDAGDAGTIHGSVICLTRVNGGYCTHTCTDDTDCCAVPGECKTGLKQVCSPFESTGEKYCFLSCEPGDLVPPDGGTTTTDNEFCQREASTDFICRSSGGGSQNRKVCVPGDCDYGEGCVEDADCAGGAGFVCLTDVNGGYCTKTGCSLNADCGQNALCVKRGDSSYCARTCTPDTAYECDHCRPLDSAATCTDQVTFVDATTTPQSVCEPVAK
jgi:hypothetical protein